MAAVSVATTSTKEPAKTLLGLPLHRWIPYVLLALSVGLAITASWYLSSSASATTEAEFLASVDETRRQIDSGLNTYFEAVRAGAVLLTANNEISGAEFRGFVAGLQLAQRYPGLDSIGFAPRVSRPDLRTFLRTMHLDGVERVRVWPRGRRAEYYPTLFLEPSSPDTAQAIGFDLATDPTLSEAMTRARDTGMPAISGRLMVTAEAGPGWRGHCVLFIPVYRTGRPSHDAATRRRALVGFVFSPLDSESLFQQVSGTTARAVSFEVYDGAHETSGTLLSKPNQPASGRYRSSGLMEVGGREWLVIISSVGATLPVGSEPARSTLLGGLLLALMLFVITRAQVRAWETAVRHEAELRAAALAMKDSEAQARAANRAKDEFLATLSHELRTPLNAMLGWVSMLRLGTVREERRDHALEIIERNARHQAELIDDLLDVSRIVTGKLRLQLRPLALAPIVAAVADSLRPSAEAKAITLHRPYVTDTFAICGDADRLHQMVWNLASNAIKFTPEGGHVYIELTRDVSHIVLSVRDTGAGIATEFLPHVFERFRQADSSTTRAHSGVGLGLAIVRHLVDLHGASIDARSDGPGRGAEFVIRFPAATALTEISPRATPVLTPRLDGVRVLVVDDDPGTRELLTEALGAKGAQVTAADSARQALDLLHADGADVIVSDIAMPAEDGFWLMRRIRSLPTNASRIPAIALTALARAEDRAQVEEAGFQMHLAKPVKLGELQAGLATLVAQQATHDGPALTTSDRS
jgi:signal transduction histidine kinase/ActR/RegA family two-component response regulator